VETVHNLIEVDFYEIETFIDRTDFIEKANTYQLFFNLERPNTYKENKSPWQLAQEKRPDMPKEALMLPAVDLDALLSEKLAYLSQGGYDVSSGPLTCHCEGAIATEAISKTGLLRLQLAMTLIAFVLDVLAL